MSLGAEYSSFRNGLLLDAEVMEELQGTVFFELFADAAIENGDLENLEYCSAIFEGTPKFRIDGYSLNIEQGELSLAICDFRNAEELQSLNASEAKQFFKQVDRFFEKACDEKFINKLEDSSPTFQAAYLIYNNKAIIKRVRVALFSSARMAIRKKLDTMRNENDVRFSYSILDFERYSAIQNAKSGSAPIELDLEEYSLPPLKCLRASSEGDNYASYLVVMPAAVLGEIYGLFGARLLEANVRTFLQAKTKVNKGIIKTLKEQPENFFAFNNGLTATASDIVLKETNEGTVIVKMKNLQIVNGGQTTASILYARDREKVDLSKAFVQTKLSVVKVGTEEDIVPLISRYANTQNRISEADFFSSHPFHLHLEKISRRLSAPPREGALTGTKWFYERARGQYKDAQSYMKPGERKRFLAEFPKNQMLVKTDFSKYEMSFLQKPNVVSSGAQKSFLEFAKLIAQDWDPEALAFGEGYFRSAMMRALIFRWTDRMISTSDWYKNNKAYKSQTVTYTLSVLASLLEQNKIDLDYGQIWKRQDIPESLAKFLTELAPLVSQVIQDPPNMLVSGYCRTQACWARLKKEFDYPLDEILSSCVVSKTQAKENKKENKRISKIDSGIDSQIRAQVIGERWKEIAKFGVEKRILTQVEMKVLHLAIQKEVLTEKQSVVALRALDKAIEGGFKL